MVAATVYDAADRGFRVRVAGDVCADPVDAVHNRDHDRRLIGTPTAASVHHVAQARLTWAYSANSFE
jgi:hypothetical protein